MFGFKGNNRARELSALRPRHAKLTRIPETTADLFRDAMIERICLICSKRIKPSSKLKIYCQGHEE